jgi:hypothetical protein
MCDEEIRNIHQIPPTRQLLADHMTDPQNRSTEVRPAPADPEWYVRAEGENRWMGVNTEYTTPADAGVFTPEILQTERNVGKAMLDEYRRVLDTQLVQDAAGRAAQLDENPGLWVRLHPSVRSLVLPDLLQK